MEEKTQEISPAQLIVQTVQKTGNVTDLKELLAIQKDWEANEARKAFAQSFSIAQQSIEAVIKTRVNTQTKSKYAELGDVIESSKPVYTKEGFSVIFYEGDCPKENHVRIYADVLHCAGHKETYHYDVPMDGKGLRGNENLTAIHGKASSVSYGRRYLMCMIWNIPTADDDGNTQSLPKVTEQQLHQIRDLILAKDIATEPILKYLKIESFDDLLASDYMKCIQAINMAKKGNQ